jgi:hypothetical protein
MAKKSRRSISSGNGSPTSASPSTTAPAPAVATRPSTSFASSRSSYTTEFKPDYSLVISDLKRIGSLVAVFATVLIILAFFLR